MDEQEFRKKCDAAMEHLQRRLEAICERHDFEVEGESGKIELQFEDADETRFVVSPNTPVRQIWISALSTSFKLDWSEAANGFVLEKTGEGLKQLVARLINQQLGEEAVTLS